MTSPRRAVVLIAHGSRDPLWRQPLEAVAERIVQRAPGLAVRCAYLELSEPDLATVVAELSGLGVGAITVVPMFLGAGKHARDDLPLLVERLRSGHPYITFTLQRAIGEDSRLLDLLAQIALE